MCAWVCAHVCVRACVCHAYVLVSVGMCMQVHMLECAHVWRLEFEVGYLSLIAFHLFYVEVRGQHSGFSFLFPPVRPGLELMLSGLEASSFMCGILFGSFFFIFLRTVSESLGESKALFSQTGRPMTFRDLPVHICQPSSRSSVYQSTQCYPTSV